MNPQLKRVLNVMGVTLWVTVFFVVAMIVLSMAFNLLSAPNTVMNVIGAVLLPTSAIFFGCLIGLPFIGVMKKSKNM